MATYRTMVREDYAAVYALWLRTPGVGLRSLDDSEEGVARFLDRNPRTCFVAEEDGAIVGVLLGGQDGRRGYIYHTVVDENLRGRGIGSALVAAVTEAFQGEGIRKIALVAFRANERGNAFWERRGFTERQDLVYRNRSLDDKNV